ncbi:MAG: hypothetical protein R2795_17740 [Saprospiraceae bacterium]
MERVRAESASRAKSMKNTLLKETTYQTPNPTQYIYVCTNSAFGTGGSLVYYQYNAIALGADNSELFQFDDASADDYECPTVVTDKEHKSCGSKVKVCC